MPLTVLIAAMPKELETLVAATRRRPDLEPIPCPSGVAALDAISSSPAVALVRLRLPDVDGLDIVFRLRRAASPETRVFMLLDEAEVKYRDASFRAGCDDIVYTPLDAEDLGGRLAAAGEAAYRRVPRVPLAATVKLGLPDGERTAFAEGISPLALRVKWTEAAPPRIVVPLSIESGGETRALWGRLEDLATKKGEPEGLIVRFVGMTRAEVADLGAFVESRKGIRAAPLETGPEGPARYEPKPEESELAPLPPPPPAAEPGPRRGRRRMLALGVIGIAGVAMAISAWNARALFHPSKAYEPKPVRIVDGLRVKRIDRVGEVWIVLVDASWYDLDAKGREKAATSLARSAIEDHALRFELYGPRGRVATAQLDREPLEVKLVRAE